jgi:AraC family transcriptional regulator, regulatory protein of adaptative response / DNA-3-methyladenine glycosylase II
LSKNVENGAARSQGGNLELDPAFCWQAVYSRDRRFDGRFFAGITTTGVYCRSTCPVSFGAPDNVRWFQSAAAAETAGFRPCKRCHPDTSPGSSAWFGTWAVVSHAIKLISQGALNDGNLEQLADRVGIGSRHLRRLFRRHLGASPLKIARSHRVQIARNLIAETGLSPREIARCTGFASIRQFNHSVKTTFGQSPTELRRLQKSLVPGDRQTGVIVYLPYRMPFDWSCLIRFLSSRATPCVEAIDDGFYRRTIEIEGSVGTIEVWDEPSQTRLAMRVCLPKYDCLMQVVQRACRLFDLGADALHIGRHLVRDRTLAGLVAEHPGLRVPGAWDGFELAVRAILGQQLMAVDSPTLVSRIVETYGEAVGLQIPGLSRLFPRPEVLAEANLSGLGIPRDRGETIISLAHAVVARKIAFNGTQSSVGTIASLRVLPNMKESTISYIAMRSLGEPDVLPNTDLELYQALSPCRAAVPPADLPRIFEKFRPWRAYAAIHLWAGTQKARVSVRPSSTGESTALVGALTAGARISRVRNTPN